MGGGSKWQTVGYRYGLTVHMGVCYGPVDRVEKILADDRDAYTASITNTQTVYINQPSLFGGDEKEGGIQGDMHVQMGASNQTPSTYLTRLLGNSIPAFRGILGFVYTGIMSANNPYLKPFSFVVRRILKGWQGDVWYPEKAMIASGDNNSLQLANATWRYRIESVSSSNTYPAPSYDDSSWNTGVLPAGGNNPGIPFNIQQILHLRTGLILDEPIDRLVLEATIDNGWDVYVNGILVHQYSHPYNQLNTAVIDGSHFVVGENIIYVRAYDDEGTHSGDGAFFDLRRSDGSDMNPAHIIYECLTNINWGMGYPVSSIDDENFRIVADTLYNEGFGLSLIWNQQNSIEAFLGIIFNHIGGSLNVDPKTGKYQIRLVRQDYDVSELPVFDPSNISEMVSYQRAGWGELVNEVTLKYTDPTTFDETAVTIQNLAAIQIQGGVVNQTVSYTGITNSNLAQRVAMRELIARSSPLAKSQFKVNRQAWKLLPNGIFKLSWPKYGISELVMRVVSIGTGTLESGVMTIDAVEDVFGLPTNTYTNQQDNEWQDPLQPPAPSPYRKLTEVTHYDLVTTLSPADLAYIDPDDGYPMMFASRPSVAAYDYKLFIDGNDVDQGGHCALGTITTLLAKEEHSVIVITVDDSTQITVGEYAVINDEYVRIDAFNDTTNQLTIARGVIDTVPVEHPADSLVFFGDGASTSDPSASPIGAILQAKVITRTGMGELDPSLAPVDTVTIQARHNKPYPPAKFRINGEYLPESVEGAITVSWNERNRLLQDSNMLDQDEASFTPEAGTTYTIKVYDQNNVLCRTLTGLTGTSYTYPISEELADCGGEQPHITLELLSVRDGIESWQAHTHTFERVYGDYGDVGYGFDYGGSWGN